jgi:hypothetical protein
MAVDGVLLFGNVAILLIVICSLAYAITCYKARRSWPNFFIVRALMGCLIAQISNIFSLQFNLWSQTITIQLEYTLGAVGTLSQLILSVYRFAIFKDVLPPWTAPFLIFKRYAAFFGVFFLLYFIPLSVILFRPLSETRTPIQVMIAYVFIWIWYVLWQVCDFGLCLWSLFLSFKVKKGLLAKQSFSAHQRKYFVLCVVTIVCLLISDIVFWPSMYKMIEVGYQIGGVLDQRVIPELIIAAPMMILHIAISFVFLHFNIRFVSSSQDLKEMKVDQTQSINLPTNPTITAPQGDVQTSEPKNDEV